MKRELLKERIENYFLEAKKHISKIKRIKKELKDVMPLNKERFESLDELNQDKIDVLIFRFSKLQDLLGQKIFRAISEYSGFDANVSFVKILSELERESFIEVDRWRALRDARNSIAHEYPGEEEHLFDEINFIYDEVDYLIYVYKRLEGYFNEINSR